MVSKRKTRKQKVKKIKNRAVKKIKRKNPVKKSKILDAEKHSKDLYPNVPRNFVLAHPRLYKSTQAQIDAKKEKEKGLIELFFGMFKRKP
ncbi:MAG: hypothetical protein WC462_03715 [archaeon]